MEPGLEIGPSPEVLCVRCRTRRPDLRQEAEGPGACGGAKLGSDLWQVPEIEGDRGLEMEQPPHPSGQQNEPPDNRKFAIPFINLHLLKVQFSLGNFKLCYAQFGIVDRIQKEDRDRLPQAWHPNVGTDNLAR